MEYDFLALCDFKMSIEQKKFYKYYDYLTCFDDEQEWTNVLVIFDISVNMLKFLIMESRPNRLNM